MQKMDLNAGPIHYTDSGSGEPILFVHGLLVNGRLWERAAALLSADFRCIVPDWPLGAHPEPMRPGADLSPPAIADMVVELMDSLGLERATIVGNDSGGAISQLMATAHPDRVGRLVLTNCDLYEDFPPKLFAYFRLVRRIPGGLTAMAQTMRLKALRRTPIAFGVLTKSRLPDELLDAWLDPLIRNPAIRRDALQFIRGVEPELTVVAAERLASFPAPTLFAWAPEDRWFRIADAERLAGSMPNARVERIAGAKTFVSIDQPNLLADSIAAFMREPAVA